MIRIDTSGLGPLREHLETLAAWHPGGRRGGKGHTATFRIIPRGAPIPPCLDAGWAAPDIEGDLADLTDDERARLQAWADHGPPVPGVTIWRSADPWQPDHLTITCRPSITTLHR